MWMKKYFSFIIFLLILSSPALSVSGPAISPGCIPMDCSPINATIGDVLIYEVRAYNFDDFERDFSVFVEKDLKENIRLNPTKFTLNPRKSGGCMPQNGCQLVNITINLTEAKPGNYSVHIIAQSSLEQQGALAVIQQVASRMSLRVVEKKTLFNKIKGFFAAKTKSAVEFYRSNTWLNYLFVLILVLFAFWLGNKFRKMKLRSNDSWEINTFKYKNYFIFLILSYNQEKIKVCEIFKEKRGLVQILKDEFKHEIPKRILINKIRNLRDDFEKFLKRNKVEIRYIKISFKIPKLIAGKLKDCADITEAQEKLNDYIKVLNREQINELIRKRKEKYEKET